MKIGIIGSGKIGGTLGVLWAKAGHEVFFSSRHPERLRDLVREAGPTAKKGSPEEAARFGEVILLSIPYGALPEISRTLGKILRGKIVLDTGNPFPSRDGEMAQKVLESGLGAGVGTATLLPDARVVRAFNTVYYEVLRREAHRRTDRIGVPLASNDRKALAIAAQLVENAGFDPVIVGDLAEAVRFDVGKEVFASGMSGDEVRRALHLEQPEARP